MTFKDVLNEVMMNGTQLSEADFQGSMVALIFSVVVGLYLFVVYKLFVRKTLYNINLNITLVGMTVIVAAIMLTIQSNLILSLGMVGALSIVRYRTAVKDPMDLFFLFWSIAGGIMSGAGQFKLAVIVTVILTLIVFILSQLPTMKAPYVLVINGKYKGLEDAVTEVLENYSKHYKIKSRSIVSNTERMIIELKISDEKELLDDINQLEVVEKVSLLTYEGDVVG